MPSMSQREMEAFLRQPRVAVFSTVRPDGTLHSAPVWFEYEQGKFYFWTGSTSVKARNIERHAETSACIATHDEPYRYVSAGGPVETIAGDIADRCLSICRRYFSEERARAFVQDDLIAADSVILVMTPRTLVTENSA